MQISSFDDLLAAARHQTEPQRLLLVFARAELPEGASAAERARFEAGQGGALVPQVCVDKSPHEVQDFRALIEESQQFAPDWAIVFVAVLSGRDGQPLTAADVDRAIDRHGRAVRLG